MMRHLVLLLLVCALVATACSDEERALYDAWLQAAWGPHELARPEQPADVQAVGRHNEAEKKERESTDDITQSLDRSKSKEERLRHADKAVDNRPNDGRRYYYRAWVKLFTGDGDGFKQDLGTGNSLYEQNHPDDAYEKRRLQYQGFMDVALEVLKTYDVGSPHRILIAQQYCNTLRTYNELTGSDMEAAMYRTLNVESSVCLEPGVLE